MPDAVRTVSERSTCSVLSGERAAERRGAPRADVKLTVRYRLPGGVWAHGVSIDLSETGGAFMVDGAWHLVERIESEDLVPIEVEIRPADSNEPLWLNGEVVWVQPDGGGAEGVDRIGVRFRNVPLRDASRLCRLLGSRRG